MVSFRESTWKRRLYHPFATLRAGSERNIVILSAAKDLPAG
jgi:hypothetical protein